MELFPFIVKQIFEQSLVTDKTTRFKIDESTLNCLFQLKKLIYFYNKEIVHKKF